MGGRGVTGVTGVTARSSGQRRAIEHVIFHSSIEYERLSVGVLRSLRRHDADLRQMVDHAARQFPAVGGSEAELPASNGHAITLVVTRRLT
jgi:hypothetical protein